MCFNPRARDGRELPKFTNIIITNVSIHAPVMDANSQSEINAKRAHRNTRWFMALCTLLIVAMTMGGVA